MDTPSRIGVGTGRDFDDVNNFKRFTEHNPPMADCKLTHINGNTIYHPPPLALKPCCTISVISVKTM